MAEYTEADKLAFKKKDYLYARQTAANCAAEVFQGKAEDTPVDKFKAYADSIFEWLFQEQDRLPKQETSKKPASSKKSSKKKDSDDLPTPTAQQQVVLEAIQAEIGWDMDKLKKYMLDYAKTVHNIDPPQYPALMGSVKTIVNYIKQGE